MAAAWKLNLVLRKEWDELAAKNPDRLSIKYVLDKEPRGWKGQSKSGACYTRTDSQARPALLHRTCSLACSQRETTKYELLFAVLHLRSSQLLDPRMAPDKESCKGLLRILATRPRRSSNTRVEVPYTRVEVFSFLHACIGIL